MVKLVDYLPSYYDDNYEMQHLVAAEQGDFNGFDDLVFKTMLNQFVSQADSRGLSLFEDQLGIVTNLSDTLENRRFRILAKLLPPRPITINYFNSLLKSLGIPSKLSVDYIKSYAMAKANYHEITADQIKQLRYLLNVYLPANLVYDIITQVLKASDLKLFLGVGQIARAKGVSDPGLTTFASSDVPLYFGTTVSSHVRATSVALAKSETTLNIQIFTLRPQTFARAQTKEVNDVKI